MPDYPDKDDCPPSESSVEIKEVPVAENGDNEVVQDDQPISLHSKNSPNNDEPEKQDESASPNTTIVRRRYKRINRPLYYIGGNNGTHIVEEFLNSLGWERINDKTREDYRLKWCEIKSHNNYYSFREGEQLCYQIPNNKVLTTKIGLLTSLQEYDRVMFKVKKGRPRIMKYQDFFPETYRLDLKEERETFFDIYKDNEIWISKPTGLNQGKGIYLIRSREDIAKFQEKMADIEEDVTTTRKLPFKVPMARIVQRYITNPLLLDGKKFDVRNYMLISSTLPLVVFYRDGYCRLTCQPYDERSTDLTGHLTNQFMQKKNPLYQEVKDETVWSMDRFNDYVNEHHMEKHNLPQDWVHTVLRKRCQQIMLHCFQSVRHKLECRMGFFDLYGCDFIVDDNFKVSLLEFNCNPALHTNCGLLKDIVPNIVNETLKLVLETFNKAKNKERIMPLASQEDFVLLYNGDLIEAEERREKLRSAAEARKRARSAQRRKKFINFNMRNPFQNNKKEDGEGEIVVSSTAGNTDNAMTACTNAATKLSSNETASRTTTTTTTASLTTQQPIASRSQTSLSTASTLHSVNPSRVTQSRSMPNVSQKKPFYAGGSVPSRPFSAPRFQRNRNKASVSNNQEKVTNSSPTEECSVTEASVAASLDAKIKVYKSYYANNRSNNDYKQKESKDSSKQVTKSPYPKHNTTKSPEKFNEATRFLITHVEEELGSDDESRGSEFSEDNDENGEEVKKAVEGAKKIIAAVTASVAAMQAPSAKLPPNYHKASLDNDFSKRYLASLATSKKAQNKMLKTSSLKVYKTPLPSALSYQQRDSSGEGGNESTAQQQKVQYRTPTTVRVRQTLQATTCTLEIGPKLRRGLVAVPTTTSPIPLVQSNRSHKVNATKLRMVNTSVNMSSSPPLEINSEHGTLPGVRISLEDPHLEPAQLISQQIHESQDSIDLPSYSHSTERKMNHHITSVDSSTQTPISNSTLTSEEKVIWRLRTRIGANSNIARNQKRLPLPSNEHLNHKNPSPNSLTSMNSTKMHVMSSPRYIAVRPALNTGITIAISPPAVVSGKNLLPSLQETRSNADTNMNSGALFPENSPTSSVCTLHASRHSQTLPFDMDNELPSGTTVRTILDGVARAKFENRTEKWMTAG